MIFSKDEQCAIIYTCVIVARADDNFNYLEQEHISQIAMKIGMREEDIAKVKRLNNDSAMAILREMSGQKKDEVRKILQSVAEVDGNVPDSEALTILTLVIDMCDI